MHLCGASGGYSTDLAFRRLVSLLNLFSRLVVEALAITENSCCILTEPVNDLHFQS